MKETFSTFSGTNEQLANCLLLAADAPRLSLTAKTAMKEAAERLVSTPTLPDAASRAAEVMEIVAKATPGKWVVQDGCSWRRIGTKTPRAKDGNVLRPHVHTDHSWDFAADDGKRDYNLAAIVAAVNFVRDGLPALIAAHEALPSPIADIAVERARQIAEEGWTADHDDAHDNGELADAAACYARGKQMSAVWPWDDKWWKPGPDRRGQLVKAAALIVAEIERLDRQALGDGK